YRPVSESGTDVYLPFYELLQQDPLVQGGKNRSTVTWKNYRAVDPNAPAPKERRSGPTPELSLPTLPSLESWHEPAHMPDLGEPTAPPLSDEAPAPPLPPPPPPPPPPRAPARRTPPAPIAPPTSDPPFLSPAATAAETSEQEAPPLPLPPPPARLRRRPGALGRRRAPSRRRRGRLLPRLGRPLRPPSPPSPPPPRPPLRPRPRPRLPGPRRRDRSSTWWRTRWRGRCAATGGRPICSRSGASTVQGSLANWRRWRAAGSGTAPSAAPCGRRSIPRAPTPSGRCSRASIRRSGASTKRDARGPEHECGMWNVECGVPR